MLIHICLSDLPLHIPVTDPATSMILGASAGPTLAVDQNGWSTVRSRGMQIEPSQLKPFVTCTFYGRKTLLVISIHPVLKAYCNEGLFNIS